MKNLFFALLVIFFIPSLASAQSNGANPAANGASGSGKAMGAVSIGMGGTLIAIGAHMVASGDPPAVAAGTMMMVTGASLVMGGISDLSKANGYQNTGNQIVDTPVNSGPACADCVSGLDPYTQGLLDQANQAAAATGSSIPALASQAAGDGGGGGGGGLGGMTSSLPSEVKDALAKKAAEVAAHYNVSSVALEGGGGGGRKGGANSDMDINAILNGLKDRSPASVAGLQKSLNGEPIGVAQDNIFQQVSRKYQKRIAARMFLPFKK